jgi:hypothetical protein
MVLIWSSISCALQDVINNVPPHWMDGVIEHHGSRHAGQVSPFYMQIYASSLHSALLDGGWW